MSSSIESEHYWEQFSILPADLDHLANFLVEQEAPQTLKDLTHELIRYRNQQIVSLLKDTLSQGHIYRPKDKYAVGERVLFPHLGDILGEVIAVRSGHNPEFEPFSVMRVRTENGEETEFVMDLRHEHPLNEMMYLPKEEDLSADDLCTQYGDRIRGELQRALETNGQFLSVEDQWFLRDLIVEITPGQLNIAEAMLDMAGGGPLSTTALLAELDLPEEVPEALQAFSLEYALLRDRRFDEVGPTGQAMWYLRQMEPREVLETPPLLHYMPIPYNRGLLDKFMLKLEQEIDDEWSDEQPDIPSQKTTTIVLPYRHWRSGTLPLSARVAKLFPSAHITDRIRFTFVDGHTKEEFPGWVVRSGRYVYGLQDWFHTYHVNTGSYIDLEQKEDEPEKIYIRVRPLRSHRSEWLRSVTIQDGKLNFAVLRARVYCEFDEQMTISVSDPDAIDQLAEQMNTQSLESILELVFNGLSGLSLQRAVHATALYSMVNLIRRVTPAPLLSILATSSRYNSLGDNYWAYRGEN